ncbi:hypothetical protein OOU_Y34scaffold00183g9 [Pyricularia oryzae Y34]|uniref:Uncharacterized protein n=2 Tax=Pyricularia oryzae TaxID=318829 RepID=A0AA97PQ92_PYRO3|nr:hypothetical protein OOU_Y34scaffold00183g9 [Pyricularia oryzae Y34]
MCRNEEVDRCCMGSQAKMYSKFRSLRISIVMDCIATHHQLPTYCEM